MSSWPHKRLSEVATLNPRRPKLERDDAAETTFIPMSAVGEDGVGVTSVVLKPFTSVKKGYTYFEDGDVIFAKITPCMQNGKHAIIRGCNGGFGFGSTEFHVVRPGAHLIAEWLHFFLIQPSVLRAATEHFTGAVGQQRVPDEYLSNLVIPLPPVDEQIRFAMGLSAALAETKRIFDAAAAQLAAARALVDATVKHDIGTAWPKVALRTTIAEPMRTGISKPASSAATERCLTLSSVRGGTLDLDANKSADVTGNEAAGNRVRPGAFYVVRGNGNRALVARGGFAPAVLPRPVLFPDLLIQVIFDATRVHPEFVRFVWHTPEVRADLEARSQTAAGIYKINLRNLGEVLIPLPPLYTQRRFASRWGEFAAAAGAIEKSVAIELEAVHAIPERLLAQTFAGGVGRRRTTTTKDWAEHEP